MQSFVEWYILRATLAQLHFINNSLKIIEDTIGIKTNAKYLFAPIFGDTTYVGRILSVIIRGGIVLFGVIAIIISGAVLFLIPLLWILWLPLLSAEIALLIVPILALLYFFLYARYKPEAYNPKPGTNKRMQEYMNKETRDLIKSYPTEKFWQVLLGSPSVINITQRTMLPMRSLFDTLPHLYQIPREQLDQKLEELSGRVHLRYFRKVHILYALLELHNEEIKSVLLQNKLDIEQLSQYLEFEEYEYREFHPPQVWDVDYELLTGGGTNRTWQGTVTPILNQYSKDITALVKTESKKVVRQALINQVQQQLQKSQNANVLLIGESGVGKDTLVHEIAQSIVVGGIRGPLWSKRIVELDSGQLIAGASGRGAFEQRVENILEEVTRSRNIILYIDNFTTALETKTDQGVSLFSLLQSTVKLNRLHILGALTPKELKSLELSYPEFKNLFNLVEVPPTDKNETLHILHDASLRQEQRHNIYIPYPILTDIYNYCQTYIPNDYFPQKAINLLEEIAVALPTAAKRVELGTIYGKKVVAQEETINEIISKQIHMPIGTSTKSESDKLLHLEQEFQQWVVDQTEAINAIAQALRRNRSGLRNDNKPVGSFLFVGPTGVGKTEMAKTVARVYFGNEAQMIRLDMTEYQSVESIERLIGSPGQMNSTTTLTEKVRQQPFSLILLDEFEKAHASIHDIFLQILDDARLTDANGTTVHFNQTIIVATSNAATAEITKKFQLNINEDQYSEVKKEIYNLLVPYFKIELLNRFDEIIVFKPLTKRSIDKIVRMQLKRLSDKIYKERKITLNFSEETIQNVVEKGFNTQLGARPLNRQIQNEIESPLAIKLLEGKVQEGQTLTI